MTRKYFGTDGIRGVANIFPLDHKTIKALGIAAASILTKINKNTKKSILIGRDTRISGEWIVEDLRSGINAYGLEVIDIGIMPTPAISFLVRKLGFLGGAVISASHNPYEYNGIKFFDYNGEKLNDDTEHKIERELELNLENIDKIDFNKKSSSFLKEAALLYSDFLKNTVDKEFNLKGLKAVIDCANGALYDIAPKFFSNLGLEVIALNNKPNGENINLKCGSLYYSSLKDDVLRHNADLGFAFDGDGDRVLFLDEKGNTLDGDYMMAILSKFLKEQNKLKNDNLVVTVMSNLGLKIAMKRENINLLDTDVGDRYVFEMMQKSDSTIGGEQSGHIILKDFISTGDGMLTALQLLNVIKTTGRKLSDLRTVMKKLPQVLVNLKVKNKKDVDKIEELVLLKDKIESDLNDLGRVFIRYSGTEPLLRVMIEGEDKEHIKELAENYIEVAKKYLC